MGTDARQSACCYALLVGHDLHHQGVCHPGPSASETGDGAGTGTSSRPADTPNQPPGDPTLVLPESRPFPLLILPSQEKFSELVGKLVGEHDIPQLKEAGSTGSLTYLPWRLCATLSCMSFSTPFPFAFLCNAQPCGTFLFDLILQRSDGLNADSSRQASDFGIWQMGLRSVHTTDILIVRYPDHVQGRVTGFRNPMHNELPVLRS